MTTQRRRGFAPAPERAPLGQHDQPNPLARRGVPQAAPSQDHRRESARRSPAAARQQAPARRGQSVPSEAGADMDIPAGTLVASIPMAIVVGDMLMTMSLEQLPQAIAWGLLPLFWSQVSSDAFKQGTIDFFVDAMDLSPEVREKLKVPHKLQRAKSKSIVGDIIAPVRTWHAAVQARAAGGHLGVDQEKADAAAARRAVRTDSGWSIPGQAAGADEEIALASFNAIDNPDSLDEAPDIGLPVVRIEDIANADNLWVVGPKNSGKTTTIHRLLQLRRGAHIALDPHATPGKWPRCQVVGGGRDFAAIDIQIDRFIGWMDQRYKAQDDGKVTEAQCKSARRSLVGDEWRAIRTHLPGTKGSRKEDSAPSAASRLLDILSEGRKAGICALVASHADTAESMGVSGEKDILRCFDYIIYLGAMATKYVPEASKMERPAVVFDPERDAWAQLIITLDQYPEPPGPHRSEGATRPLVSAEAAAILGEPAPQAAPARPAAPRPAAPRPASPPVDDFFATLLGIAPPPAAVPKGDRSARLAAILARQAEAAASTPAGGTTPQTKPTPASVPGPVPSQATAETPVPGSAPDPEPQPAADAPVVPPPNQPTVTVDQGGGREVHVHVYQARQGFNARRRAKLRQPKKSEPKQTTNAVEDEALYQRAKEILSAPGGSANKVQRELHIGRRKALGLAARARGELGLGQPGSPA